MNRLRVVAAFATFVTISNADNLYSEGFLNPGNLPGNLNDPRHMPNLPFSTDTNIVSDGVSSTDPYSTLSPDFPLYSGVISNGDHRYMYYKEYIKVRYNKELLCMVPVMLK